jgi:valyl-tRNA synthetase
MSEELPKAYVAKDYEDAIYKQWEDSGKFAPCEDNGKKPFVITMPPPNATGTLHLGHAVMLAVEDIMIRFHRMKGHPTIWVPGTDHAGIATQNKVEKDVLEKEGKTRHDYGREAFIKKIEEFVAGSQDTIRNQTRKMGASCDWTREYYSLDDSLSRTVHSTFKKMFEEGLIYRGDRIVNWCTRCASTISDEEVDYVEKQGKFYYFQYGPFEIATARPETKFGDHIVVVHPDDERYKKYHGKKIEIDWLGDEPITATVVADEASDPEMGSGVMTATPAHSFVDFDLAKKHGFEVVQMIDEEGKMTEANGPFAGITVEDARETFVKILEKKGLINKIDENYVNNLSVCSRCKTPIQPLISKQWFIDVNHPVNSWDYENLKLEKGNAYSLKQVMLHVVRGEQIEIIPDRFNKTYFQWIENLRDWCISRQLWWGHQIPVWFDPADPDNVKVQEESPGEGWERDSDTLDTWFSAGLFTFSPLKWIDGDDDFKRFHPTQVLETGYDILFFWVARMILMTTYVVGQVPFEKVYLHGLIRTREGKKMSKSDPSTCIDPLEIIPEYGADALRLSLFVGSTPGNDSRLYDEKIAGYRNFVNKLWNVARYILMSVDEDTVAKDSVPSTQTLADKWILSRLHDIVESTSKNIKEFRFSQAAEDLYAFTWNDLADWYLEITKIQKAVTPSSSKESASDGLSSNTDQILMYILRTLLKLWHPFTPFVTEELWKHVREEGNEDQLMTTEWPEPESSMKDEEAEKNFQLLQDAITSIRALRAEYKVEPAKKISSVIVSKDYQVGLDENAEIIKHLARLESLTISGEGDGPEGSASTVIDGMSIYLPLEGMIDPAKEKARLEKEIKKLSGYVTGLESKLGNAKFVDNAPEEVVKAEKERLETAKNSLAECEKQLGAL